MVTDVCTGVRGLLLCAAAFGLTAGCHADSDRPANRAAPAAAVTRDPPAPQDPLRPKLAELYAGGPDARAAELEASPNPIRSVAEELTLHGKDLYGRSLPMFLGYSADRGPLDAELPSLGCPPKLVERLSPEDGASQVRELFARCPPHGPHLAAAYTIANNATVGRATLALMIEALATDEMRATKLHHALVAALLGPASRTR